MSVIIWRAFIKESFVAIVSWTGTFQNLFPHILLVGSQACNRMVGS